MAFLTSTVLAVAAIASAVVGVASYASAEKSRKEAQSNYAAQASAQRDAQSEQTALNSQRAAEERRQQVREQRVKAARLAQSAENTGTEYSSGALGAESGFATQLGANIGSNLGAVSAASRIGQFAQTAADFGSAAQRNLSNMGAAQNLFSLSGTIFSASGGASSIKTEYNRVTA